MLNVVIKLGIILITFVVLGYLFLKFYPGIGRVPSFRERKLYAKYNDLYYAGKFHNISKASIDASKNEYKVSKSLKWIIEKILKISEYDDREAKNIRPKDGLNVLKINKMDKPSKDKITITWLGHSSLLIQMDGKNILTDPALTEYASPFGFTGFKRFNQSPIDLDGIDEIDVLLISHDHYDHLDYKTIKKIDSKVKKYIVPLGVESYLIGWKVNKSKIITLNWWENQKIDNVLFTAIPAKHYSMRNPMNRDATLWCGFLMQCNGKKLYFTGDTGYSETFSEVNNRFGAIDLFMADTGQYNKAWSGVHMNPYDALRAAKDVGAKYYMPVHWGAFALSNHDWFEPANITTSKQAEYCVKVVTPRIGEVVDLDLIGRYTSRWWEDEEL